MTGNVLLHPQTPRYSTPRTNPERQPPVHYDPPAIKNQRLAGNTRPSQIDMIHRHLAPPLITSYLGNSSCQNSITALCERTIGIHAARVQTPFITAASRSPTIDYSELYAAQNVTRTLIKLRCMRNTLHICSLPDASLYHAATIHFRLLRCAAEETKIPDYTRLHLVLRNAIIEHLDGGCVSERTLEQTFTQQGRIKDSNTLTAHRATMKRLWEEGTICIQDQSPSWRQEHRTFGLTKNIYGPAIFADKNRLNAIQDLVLRYFRTFGPATLGDFSWWSGIGKRSAHDAITNAVTCGTLAPTNINHTQMYYAPEQQSHDDQFESLDNEVRLLAWEDLYLKAYYETRWRYAPAEHSKNIFNSIGEARRTILHRGTVIGTWDVNKQGIPISHSLFEPTQRLNRQVRDEIRKLAIRLSDHEKPVLND